MPPIEIPRPLLPAITPDREVIEFLIDQDLEKFGENSLVARTWHWILHGAGLAPISHTRLVTVRRRRTTISRHPRRRKHRQRAAPAPARPWEELNQARFIRWLCTAQPGDELPLRFNPGTPHGAPTVTEEGPATVTMREIRNG
jgi:hypothetical protein